MKTQTAKRSPLKAKPLRYAGQSLDDEIIKQVDEGFAYNLTMIFLLFMFTIYEWLRWYFDWHTHPIIITVTVLVAAAYYGTKAYRTYQHVQKLKLGRDGERAVGQYLESLREDGYRVFHDITGNNFNVDHVLIGRTGVYAIETKTWSKPASGKSVILFHGDTLTVNGYTPDRNPIDQAQACANHIAQLLEESTGKKLPVRPVVLFPGWYVERKNTARQHPAWVLEPKAFAKFLSHEPVKLPDSDVKLASSHLSRYIRTL